MDFFARLTLINVGWGFLCLLAALFAGAESDINGTPWARRWWPRFAKIGLTFFVLATGIFLFN